MMSRDQNEAGEACPVDHKTREAWLQKSRAAQQSSTQSHPLPQATPSSKQYYHPESGRIKLPLPRSAPSPDAQRSTHPLPKLSSDREISSIPRALASPNTPQPSHSDPNPTTPSQTSRAANSEQETGTSSDGRWIYPSEQQFFNALLRKKHTTAAQAADMQSIVPIHNAVNERAWSEILRWEAGRGGQVCGGPKLASFSGLSEQLTPRARWNTWVLGYQAPFDRHDWVVDRCGTRVDYVIDFYEGKNEQKEGRPLNFYLDVRPKLNTVEGCKMRIQHALGL